MKKKSHITVTDQFCGAGGSSQGVRNLSRRSGGGLEVSLAMNHWKLAIETHNSNFPETMHDCTDISACDPRRYPSTDILITSPECTNHSLAKGVKVAQKQMDLFNTGSIDPTAERSRATMWDVCRFAEYHKYNAIIVENVVDARKWVMFDTWLSAMYVLGYHHKSVYLNSMHCHPTPQSRDRMYIVFWKKGNKAPDLEYRPAAHCPKCCKDIFGIQTWKNADKKFGKYRQQYVYCCPLDGTVVEPYYYAAFNCIDWSDPGKRIGNREKPLSPNTTKRIKFGLDKYGRDPYIIHAAYGDQARGVVRSIQDPTFTHTTVPSQAIINPFIINDQHSTGIDCRVKSVKEPLSGVVTTPHFKMIMPLIIKGEHTKQTGYVTPAGEAMQTQLTRQSMSICTPFVVDGNYNAKPSRAIHINDAMPVANTQNRSAVCFPFIVENKGTSKARSIDSPLGCATTVPYHGIITDHSFSAFLSAYNNGSHCTKDITQEAPSITTKDRNSLTIYNTPQIEDCYYRMLKPKEIKLAMAFDRDYIVLGSGKDQVKQLGNAVTPPAMEWLTQQVIESLK